MSQLQAGLFREILNIDQYKDNATFYYTELSSEFGINIQADILEKNIIDDDALVMKGNISCDHSAKLHYRSYNYDSRDLFFEIHKKSNGLLLTLPKETECTLKVTSNFGEEKTIFISSYKKKFPIVNELERSVPNESRKSQMLEDGEMAFNKRVEILSGIKLTQEQLDNRNPQLDLNLENIQLPKFDFIYLSTLQINNDFVNNILFRLLAAHAKLGTPVVVTVSDVLLGDKERHLLDWFQKESSNIKIISYKFNQGYPKIKKMFEALHRVSHSKLFITYSKNDPTLNHFIGGGRNMSDRYFFSQESFFGDPQYTDYEDELLNPWVYFYDLEFEVQSQKLVRDSLVEALDFSHILTGSKIHSDELYISVPFRDDHELENKFISEIENANATIQILSPYIYFTDKMKEALQKAKSRGVEIEVILSYSLLGDAMTAQVKSIYDSFINKCTDYISIYQYPTDKYTIMHRKAMLIDNKRVILGSVNLSQRSFIHDTESAFFTSDSNLVLGTAKEFKNMLSVSKKVNHRFRDKFKFLQKTSVKNLL